MAKTKITQTKLIGEIDKCLPQTQCTKCGFPSCISYAQAIAASKASINQCPPGGEITIRNLATLLDLSPTPLNADYGPIPAPQHAFIDETNCIGCTLCIQACPVDAILGAAKQMHTVITDECTGCELCIIPCPVDCIIMAPSDPPLENEFSQWPGLSARRVMQARKRFGNRFNRISRIDRASHSRRDKNAMRDEIMASVDRVQRGRLKQYLSPKNTSNTQ